jgi:omega-amidase
MKIGIAQIECVAGDVSTNSLKIVSYIEEAKASECDVVVFPEMADTGYDMAAIRETASSWNEDPFITIQQAARKAKIHVICGLSEKEQQTIYNTTVVFGPDGAVIGKYRKSHLASYAPLNEDKCISPGNSLQLVNIGGMKWGLMICYDLRFPEISRTLTLQGADVLLLCSAWPFPRLTHWNTLIQARAIENQTYFIAANRIGTDNSVTFCGSSRIVDPYGVIVSSAAEEREELIVGEIRQKVIEAVRGKMRVFQHRRNDMYKL